MKKALPQSGRLVYWVCKCLTDSRTYNIRAKTKKQASAERFSKSQSGANEYAPPKKVVIEYEDAFELLQIALQEGGCEG